MPRLDQLSGVLRNLEHLRFRLRRREGGIDADHFSRAAIGGETDQHAGMGGAGNSADHDIVELEAELLLLLAHLLGEADIAETAELVHGGAGGNGVRLAARRLDLVDRLLPALADADVEAVVDQPHVGAHDAREHDVADPVIDGVLVRHPGFLHQAALHADLGRDGGDHPGVVGLHAANRDQRVGVGGDCVRDDVFELAQLVATIGEAGIAVLALGIDIDIAAKMLRQPLQLLDGRRAEGERVARKFVELHGSSRLALVLAVA